MIHSRNDPGSKVDRLIDEHDPADPIPLRDDPDPERELREYIAMCLRAESAGPTARDSVVGAAAWPPTPQPGPAAPDPRRPDPHGDPLLDFGDRPSPQRSAIPDPPAVPTISEQILTELRGIREAVESLQPRYYSTAQMASRLGVTVGTVRRMIRREQIRTVRFGDDGRRQQHRIPRSEVERLLVEGVMTGLDTLAAEYEEESGFMDVAGNPWATHG